MTCVECILHYRRPWCDSSSQSLAPEASVLTIWLQGRFIHIELRYCILHDLCRMIHHNEHAWWNPTHNHWLRRPAPYPFGHKDALYVLNFDIPCYMTCVECIRHYRDPWRDSSSQSLALEASVSTIWLQGRFIHIELRYCMLHDLCRMIHYNKHAW